MLTIRNYCIFFVLFALGQAADCAHINVGQKSAWLLNVSKYNRCPERMNNRSATGRSVVTAPQLRRLRNIFVIGE